MEKSLLHQLGLQNFWTINKDLCRILGLEDTLLLQHFIDLQYKIFNGNEFFQQQSRIESELGYTEYQVKKCVKSLLTKKIISVSRKGLPSKNYYSINEDEIVKLLNKNTSTKNKEIREEIITKPIQTIQEEIKVPEIEEKSLSFKDMANDLINNSELEKDYEYMKYSKKKEVLPDEDNILNNLENCF
jgi:hypothetical protein